MYVPVCVCARTRMCACVCACLPACVCLLSPTMEAGDQTLALRYYCKRFFPIEPSGLPWPAFLISEGRVF